VLSRLLGYKRVDLAIEAARSVGVRTIIAGDGPERERLRAMAGDGVEFAGRVPDDELADLYAGARAFFLGGEEDFGITPLEANAAGRPVVAYGRGGALETMTDGATACLFEEQTPAAAAQALRQTLERSWDPDALAGNAARFGPDRFLRELDTAIADHVD
jgi:glycosyltransferase involved in cell wall biosynthesis